MEALSFSEPECIWNGRAVLGEGPFWSEAGQALFWVDIKAPAIYRHDPASRTTMHWPMPEAIGCLIEDGPDRFIAALKSGFAYITLGQVGHAPAITAIADPESGKPQNRFNDGKRAPDGSIWAGSMDDTETGVSGQWWRLSPGGEVSLLEDAAFKVTNGPAFDAGRDRVFLTDSAAQIIYVADLLDNGRGYANRTPFVQFGRGDGYPDGMTVAPDGSLWVAFWDGACIRRFAPDGALLQTVPVPARRPTSVCWSPDQRKLYVTSASIGLKPGGLDGGVFCLEVLAT
tara:strand:- start:7922 stop:8779 length:858 start_codon:yes stop_codon:yes gene_type:complete